MTSLRSRIWQVVGASLVLGLLASPAVFAAVMAQDPPKPQGAPDAVPVVPGNLELSLGGGVVVAPRPYEGASAAVIPIPVVSVRYKRLFADGIRGGVRFLQSGQLTGNAYLQANFEGLDATDSPSLEGITDRRMSADAGAEIVYRARPVGFRFNVLSDVLGRNSGQEVSLQALTGAPLGRGSFLLAGIGPRWVSATRVDYYYGVSGSEARPDRPEYPGHVVMELGPEYRREHPRDKQMVALRALQPRGVRQPHREQPVGQRPGGLLDDHVDDLPPAVGPGAAGDQ